MYKKIKQIVKLAGILGLAAAGTGQSLPVSAALPTKSAILSTMSLVDNKWINGHSNSGANNWNTSVYHIGNMAAYSATNNAAFFNYSNNHAIKFNWLINGGAFSKNADQQTLGQVYLRLTSDSTKLANTKSQADTYVNNSSNDTLWTWVDAIFMQMPVFTKLGNLYGSSPNNYYNQMWQMFNHTRTTLALYDTVAPVSHLWYRDANYKYPGKKSPNGKKVLWSRGNAWVFAALANTLDLLPTSDPNYNTYKTIFQDMAASLVTRQRSDGFWNSNLDDANDHGGPEVSGTSGFTYGMALGIRKGILSSATYLPVVEKAWNGLVATAIHPDGFLGYVQQVGEAPASTDINTTADFGVGLFLLAGSEVVKLASDANLALNKAVTFSSQQTGNEATHAVDGDTSASRWSAQVYPQWVKVDLGSVQSISRTEVYPYLSRAYQYKIEASADGVSFITVANKTGNTTGGNVLADSFAPFNARYVRLTVTGASGYTGDWTSINEFMVFK